MERVAPAQEKHTRRHDLDWLRVLAVLLLIYYHTGVIFVGGDWHIANEELNAGVGIFTYFLAQWQIPLLFLVAGAATWFSLGFRTGRQYLVERGKRLLVPLLFGTLVIIPPQVYFERLSRNQFRGSYLSFYPNFFKGVYPKGNLSWHNLWFLAYLLVFSLVALPLFLHLKKGGEHSYVSRFADFVGERRGAIFLLAVPLAVIEASLRGLYPSGNQNLVNDWANFLLYLVLFIYGYLLFSDPRFQRAVERSGITALVLGTISILIIFVSILIVPDAAEYSVEWILFMLLRGFNTWFWLVALLYLGRRYLDFSNRFLKYANEAVLPFYVLHQTIIVWIAYYVVQWDTGIPVKYFFISTSALIATVLLYELVVRRTYVTRFLFGMRIKKRMPGKKDRMEAPQRP